MVQFLMFLCLLVLALIQTSEALYSKGPVALLSEAAFDRLVSKDDGVWLVEFYAPWCGHCKTLVPEWERAAKALKGIVNVGAVDATKEQSLASRFSVQGFPTILIFAADKTKPEKYQNQRTAEAIVDAGLKATHNLVKQRLNVKTSGGDKAEGGPSDVVQLSAQNFDEEVRESNSSWLVEFFAPWCGHCKSLAPEYAKAATELLGTIKLGAVDCDQSSDLCGQFNVEGFPSIKFFAPDDKTSPVEFDGRRTASGIVEWSLDKLEEYGPGPEIVEATSDQILKDGCFSKKICVVGVLPHVMDTGAKGREEYLATMLGVAKKMRGKPTGFAWIPGGVQTRFEEAVGVNMNYPTVVAISASKMRYTVHRAAFSVDHITSFLKGVWSGRQRTIELKTLPALVTAEPWDGKDYVPPTEDE